MPANDLMERRAKDLAALIMEADLPKRLQIEVRRGETALKMIADLPVTANAVEAIQIARKARYMAPLEPPFFECPICGKDIADTKTEHANYCTRA